MIEASGGGNLMAPDAHRPVYESSHASLFNNLPLLLRPETFRFLCPSLTAAQAYDVQLQSKLVDPFHNGL